FGLAELRFGRESNGISDGSGNHRDSDLVSGFVAAATARASSSFLRLVSQTFPHQRSTTPATKAATLERQMTWGKAAPWAAPKARPTRNPISPPKIINNLINKPTR